MVTLWDVDTLEVSDSFVVPEDPGLGVEYLHAGTVLATTSEVAGSGFENTAVSTARPAVGRFDTRTDWRAAATRCHGSGYIGRDATGRQAFIGSVGGTAVVWDVDPRHWEDVACDIAGRNLGNAE